MTQSIHPIQQKKFWNGSDLNPIENLCSDLKTVVQRTCPCNPTDLESFWKEDWDNIAKSRCAKLIDSYPKRLMAVIKSKGASTKYQFKGVHTYATTLFQFFTPRHPKVICHIKGQKHSEMIYLGFIILHLKNPAFQQECVEFTSTVVGASIAQFVYTAHQEMVLGMFMIDRFYNDRGGH